MSGRRQCSRSGLEPRGFVFDGLRRGLGVHLPVDRWSIPQ